MDDLISRQEAITAIQEAYADTEGGADKCAVWKNVGLTNALHIMQDLPSAQPYTEAEIQKMQELEQAELDNAYECGKHDAEPRWIPCSERLPEPRMAVLGYAPRYQNIYALYYDSVDGWMVWSPVRDDFFPNSQGEIVAWMPLPEPYREEGEE